MRLGMQDKQRWCGAFQIGLELEPGSVREHGGGWQAGPARPSNGGRMGEQLGRTEKK